MAEDRFEHRSTWFHPTLDYHSLPHWALSKSIGSEAQDVKIRRDMPGDRRHPKADNITEQLDLCSGWPISGAAGHRLEPSPRVLWMNFKGQEKTSSKLVLPDVFFFDISKENIPNDYPKTVVLNWGGFCSPFPQQGTFGNVWRHFSLSLWGGCATGI